jgi:hypothetical protein
MNKLKAVCPFLLERIVNKSKNPNDVPPTSSHSSLVHGEYISSANYISSVPFMYCKADTTDGQES